MDEFVEVNINHIPRRRKAADLLAKEAKLSGLNDVWVDPIPEWIKSVVVYDCQNLAHDT